MKVERMRKFSFKPVEDVEAIERAKSSFWRKMIEDFLNGKDKTVKVTVDGLDSSTVLNGLRQYLYSERYGYRGKAIVINRKDNVYLSKK